MTIPIRAPLPGAARTRCRTPRRLRATAPPAGDFPAAGVVNAHALVSVHWLRALLEHRAGRAAPPAAPGAQDLVIVEAGWGAAGHAFDEQAGHVPGALALDTDTLETPAPAWRLRDAAALERVVGGLGIDAGTTVVVYGREVIAAARAWWVLKYLGVRDVRLLDGGGEAWQAAGYPTAACALPARARDFVALPQDGFFAGTGYVRDRLGAPHTCIGDVRSAAEHRGDTSGYDYIDARGRIPGALHLGDADDDAGIYVRADGRLFHPHEILGLWRRMGLELAADGRAFGRELVFYCGSGWRSSLAFFYAWLLGIGNVRNYSDGWSGWSTRYVRDECAGGSTPGWRQDPTGNPREREGD
jgi:thiosulfate/3-mercaptopyruvate sulfurtransferase